MKHLKTFESFNNIFEAAQTEMGGLTPAELKEMGVTKQDLDKMVDNLMKDPAFKAEAEKLIKAGKADEFVESAEEVAQAQAQVKESFSSRKNGRIYESVEEKGKKELADNLMAGGVVGAGAAGVLAGAATVALSGVAAATIAVPFVAALGASVLAIAVGKMMGGKL